MADYIDVTLKAAVRSLREVVAPAVVPGDRAAQEQLGLIADFLEFCIEKLDHLASRERFDVVHYLRLAEAVISSVEGVCPTELADLEAASAHAREVLESRPAERRELMAAAAALSGGITAVVRAVESADETVRVALERAVLAASAEREVVERAWHASAGLDPDPDELPSLAQLLARS